VELLAPVGSKDSLKAAILGGADALYLGVKHFGARRLAENFNDSELEVGVKLAHKHGLKVYVTFNILVKEKELSLAFSYLSYFDSIHIDGIIVQDRGLLKLIKDNFSMPIHASTQMGIHSPEGAIWAEKNGISRVILARELNFDELKKIREATKIELEVFVHGALCYSFSGKCLFSSLVGGRSGNRGLCAQPCRKLYEYKGKKKYWLSTADIFSIDALPRLIKMGINSVKIEGRMRSPTYVYLTSKIYSKAIKRAKNGEQFLIYPQEKEDLEVIFNRGFTKGYLLNDDIMQREHPDPRGLFLGEANFDGKRIAIKNSNLRVGDGITLFRNNKKVGGFGIKKTTKKNGDLLFEPPFRFSKGKYQLYLTKKKEFDSIKRLITTFKYSKGTKKMFNRELNISKINRHKTRSELSFYASSVKTLKTILPYADRVYFEWNKHFDEASIICRKMDVECVLILPSLSFIMPNLKADNIMVNSIDQYEKYSNFKLYGHYLMNFFNSLTIPEIFQYTLSVELSKKDIENIAVHFSRRLEVMVFGRIELMITRNSFLKGDVLIDQKGKSFPLYRDKLGYSHILNSADLFLLDFLDEMESIGINSFGIDLRRRNTNLSKIVAKAFYERNLKKKKLIKKICGLITAGHYLRGVY
jgi:putative protease